MRQRVHKVCILLPSRANTCHTRCVQTFQGLVFELQNSHFFVQTYMFCFRLMMFTWICALPYDYIQILHENKHIHACMHTHNDACSRINTHFGVSHSCFLVLDQAHQFLCLVIICACACAVAFAHVTYVYIEKVPCPTSTLIANPIALPF